MKAKKAKKANMRQVFNCSFCGTEKVFENTVKKIVISHDKVGIEFEDIKGNFIHTENEQKTECPYCLSLNTMTETIEFI